MFELKIYLSILRWDYLKLLIGTLIVLI